MEDQEFNDVEGMDNDGTETESDDTQAEDAPKVNVPKGITQEMFDQAAEIITSGFANGAEVDAIKSEVFKLGVPFSKLNTLFNMIARANDLVADPKEIKHNIGEALGNQSLSYEETYEELAALASSIVEGIKGATVAKVLAALKTDFKENEMEFPKKPKGAGSGGGRMGAITKALITLLKDNKKPSADEVKAAVLPCVKGEENAVYYTNQYHKLLYAVANDMTADAVLAMFTGNDG